MTNLTQASQQLFHRPPDECFQSLSDLHRHCLEIKNRSRHFKEPGTEFEAVVDEGHLALRVNGHGAFHLNEWSLSQLCSLAGVNKDTVNRLRSNTASQVFFETLKGRTDEDTDLQALVLDNKLTRSINGSLYKRLWSADLLAMLMEFATDFTPPQKGIDDATGLYAGEQDMFCFLIDPNGWTEIGGEAFAPGFFTWNSEVGKRTVGISTFWFQAVCQNHIIWDATEIIEVSRKHTGKVRESLAAIREAIEQLVSKRDERKDGFAKLIAQAMETRYGTDAEDVQKLLAKAGFARELAKRATDIARQKGAFTLWSVVDALTQLSREAKFAGARNEADQKASSLLSLVSA